MYRKRRPHLVWIFISSILLILLVTGCTSDEPSTYITLENQTDIAVVIYVEGVNQGEVEAGETEKILTSIWREPNEPGLPEDYKYLIEAKTKGGEVVYSKGFTWHEIDDMDWTIVIPPLEKEAESSEAAPRIPVQPFSWLITQDDEIEASLRQSIHEFNTDVVDALQKEDFDTFLGYFATGFMDENEQIVQFQAVFPQMTELAKNREFVQFRDYYCKSSGVGMNCMTFPEDEYDFQLSLEIISRDQFISLMETPYEFHNFLLSMVYIKQDNDWRIYNCHLGSYTVSDKNAIHWYKEALGYYEQQYFVPTLFRLQLANQCLYPAPFLKYNDEGEIVNLTVKAQDEFNKKYSLPVTLSAIEGNPVIFNFEPKFVKKDIVPLIKYVTSHPLENTADLEVEAQAMSPLVQELFPGITEGTTHLVFQAFSEPPIDPNKLYSAYSTAVEVD